MMNRETRFFPVACLRRVAALVTLAVFASQPLTAYAAGASVTSDPHGGKNRPVVQNAGNGLPIIQITAPSKAGVSNNKFLTFNVGPNGLIFNNSPSATATALSGYIAGNEFLGLIPAKIILAQVTAANASQLLGYMEVAGKKADVVVANPWGITCDGCGFINASRGILTTGSPTFGANGALTGLNIAGGALQIGSSGLNASNVPQLDLLAGTIGVAGPVYAKILTGLAGTNKLDYSSLALQSSAASNSAGADEPTVYAIDVSSLGGMYAGRIYLLATDQGVGVNNEGTISSTGTLSLSANGTLSNSGTLYAGTGSTIDSQGGLSNSGAIASGSNLFIAASSIDSSGTLGAGIKSDGSLASTGSLTLMTTGALAANGQNIAAGDFDLSGSSIDLSSSSTQAGGNASLVAATGDVSLTNANSTFAGTLNLSAAGDFSNAGATTLAKSAVVSAAGDFTNAGGTFASKNGTNVSLGGHFDNTSGVLQAGSALTLSSASISNTGQILSLSSDGLTLTTGALTSSGAIGGNGSVTIRASDIRNSGSITAQGNADVESTASLDNTAGSITAGGDLRLSAASSLTNERGAFVAMGTAGLSAASIDNAGGAIESGTLNVHTNSLDNTSGQIVQTGTADGQLAVLDALDNTSGIIATNAGNLTLTPGQLKNTGGTIEHAGSGTLTIDTPAFLDNSGGSINTNGALVLTASGIDNAGGVIAAGADAAITSATAAGSFDNTGGTLQTVGALSLSSSSLTNTAGLIVAVGGTQNTGTNETPLLSIATSSDITNGGTIEANGSVNLVAGSDFSNGGGSVLGTNVALSATGKITNSGTISAGGVLTADAASIENAGGTITNSGAGATSIAASGAIDNAGGTLGGGGSTAISAARVSNTDNGQVISNGDLNLTIGTLFDNTGGNVYSGGSLTFNDAGADLKNGTGSLVSQGDMNLTVDSLENSAGSIESNGSIAIGANSFDNSAESAGKQGGHVLAAGDIGLTLPGDFSYSQDQTINAGGTLTLNLKGAFANLGDLQSNGINISAASFDNAAAAKITANSATIEASTITNEGTIGAQSFSAEGTAFSNTGTIMGGTIGIDAAQISNSGAAAIIAATTAANLFGTAVTNADGAEIFSLGDINIASDGTTDKLGNLIDKAGTITNSSAVIDAEGNLAISADSIVNKRTTFTDTVVQTGSQSNETVAQYDFNPGHSENTCVNTVFDTYGDCLPMPKDGNNLNQGQLTFDETDSKTEVTDESDAGQLLSGNDMSLIGGISNEYSQISAGNNLFLGGQNAGTAPADGSYALGTTLTNLSLIEKSVKTYTNGAWNWQGTVSCGLFCGQQSTSEGPVSVADVQDPTVIGSVKATVTAGNTISGDPQTISNINEDPTGSPAGVPPAASPTDAPAAKSGPILSVAAAGIGPVSTTSGAAEPADAFNANMRVPQNGLYSVSTDPKQHYLVETNPEFTDLGKFLSSDYLLEQLSLDPSAVGKRLGDGFYEQQVVQQQILSLTGKQFLPGYGDNQDQYQYLLANGVTYAKQLNLQVGVGLTPAQIAQLKSSMVWMVYKVVDGQKVLAPVVYLAKSDQGDLNSQGSLIAAKNIDLKPGSISNSGVIQASNVLEIHAGTNIENQGQITSGGDMLLQAGNNIVNSGGTIYGTGKVLLKAGKDIQNVTGSAPMAAVASIGSGGDLGMLAGHDLTVTGAKVAAGGDMLLDATNNLTINTTAHHTGGNASWYNYSSTTNQSSSLTSNGQMVVVAGKNVNIAGSGLDAGQTLSVSGDTVNIGTATNSQNLSYHTTTNVGGPLSSVSGSTNSTSSGTQAVGSLLSGNTVVVTSKHDMNVSGSSIVGTNDVNLLAGGNLTIGSAQDTSNTTSSSTVNKGGLWGAGSGIGFTLGSSNASQTSSDKSVTQVGSNIGSIAGSVTINSNGKTTITSSDVAAKQDVNIGGESVTINAANNTDQSSQHSSQSFSGFSAGFNNNALSTATQVGGDLKQAGQSQDPRLSALLGVEAGQSAQHAAGALSSPKGLINGSSFSAGFSSSQSEFSALSNSSTAAGSTLSGNNVNIVARGGNIDMTAANVNAQNNVMLKAAGSINLDAAANTANSQTNYSSSGWSVGGTAGLNGKNGATFNASASSGKSGSSSTTWAGTNINAGGTVSMTATKDVNIIGSQVHGKTVDVTATNLTIQSLQDSSTFNSTSKNAGFSLSYNGATSGSYSSSSSTMNSNWQSAVSQAGLYAGSGGYHVNVSGTTNLIGGVISSTADPSQNTLVTGILKTSDIANNSAYSPQNAGFGVGYATGPQAANNYHGFSASPPAAVNAQGSANSTTKSAISNGSITITNQAGQLAATGKTTNQTIAGLDHDTAGSSNSLAQVDLTKVQRDMQVGALLASDTSNFLASQSSKIDALNKEAADPNLSQSQRDQAAFQAAQLESSWGFGGVDRQVLTALTGAIAGNATGSFGQIAQAGAGNFLGAQLSSQIGKLADDGSIPDGSPLNILLHAGAGCVSAIVGAQNCGASAVGAGAAAAATNWLPKTPNESFSQEQNQANLINTLAGGVGVAAGSKNLANTVNAAQTTTDNNVLGLQQWLNKVAKPVIGCRGNIGCTLNVLAKAHQLDQKQNQDLEKGIAEGIKAAGGQTLSGLLNVAQNPGQTIAALATLLTNEDVQNQLIADIGQDAFNQLKSTVSQVLYSPNPDYTAIGQMLGKDLFNVALAAIPEAKTADVANALKSLIGPKAVNAAEATAALGPSMSSTAALFYSGDGTFKTAAALALKTGRETLETVLDRNGINTPAWNPNDPAVVAWWTAASNAFAEGASGTVKCLLSDDLRPGSIFETVELPALETNPKVSQIMRVDPSTGAETVIWTRP